MTSLEALPLTGKWFVMDMDGTITPTPSSAGGHYLPLSQSPCQEPLKRWLQLGGSICVVSTAGRRMWRQIHEVLKPELIQREGAPRVGSLVISGFSGAALFHSDPHTGDLVEDSEYRLHAVEGGTCLPPSHADRLVELCCDIVRSYIARAATDDALIAGLSAKYHGPYRALAAQYQSLGDEVFRRDVVHKDAMVLHGAFLKETNDALVDIQYIPGAPKHEASAQISVLGIPFAYFADFFPAALRDELATWGVYCKSQPNSVVIARSGIDKALLVRWLLAHGDRYHPAGFELQRAVAFGDCPESIDKPLTTFPDMPFVSVAPHAAKTPQLAHVVHVGDEEKGTARFVAALLDLAAETPDTATQLSVVASAAAASLPTAA